MVEAGERHMNPLPADIHKILEHISERIEQLEADGQPEKCDRLRRVAALLQRGDFPKLTEEECDLLAEWRGANRKSACLTEHLRLVLDKWLSASRLRLSSGPRRITDEQYEEWRTWLAANSAEQRTPAPACLPSAEDDDLIESTAASDCLAETRQPAGGAQLDAKMADGPGERDDGCESNIPDRVTAPPELLEPVLAELLGRIPDTWQTYRPDHLTEIQAQGLFLLTAAGMVQRRERLRLGMANQPLVAEATLEATGEYGMVEALEPLAAHLWSDWREAFRAWTDGETRDVSPFYCERLGPAEWRLTDQGVLARQDLVAGQSRRVFDFVLGLGFFDGRPRLLPGGRITRRQQVRGAGSLVRMQKLHGQTVVAASAGVGDVGAAGMEAFVRALMGMFGALQANAAGPRPAPVAEVGADRESRKLALAEKILSAQKVLNGGTQEWVDLLPERVKFAYGQYLSAVSNVRDKATDRECYDWVKAHNEGSPLPAFETWQRYVRQARQHHGQQKNTPRAGRNRGRSIALPEDIEPPDTGEAD